MDTPTSQPYTPAPAPMTPSITPVSPPFVQSPKGHGGLIATVAILALLIGGYLAWAMSADSWPFAPTATESPSPSPSAGPTAGWKTYTNTQYGFEVRYPASWQVSSTIPNQIVQFVDPATPVIPDTDVAVNGVFIGLTSGNTSGVPTTVSGKNAFVTSWGDPESGSIGPATWKELFVLTSPGIHVTMSALSEAAKTTEDQILSTFKFTQ